MSLRPIDPTVHFTEEATLEALGHTLARSRIEAVLEGLQLRTRRTRKLPLVLLMFLCIAMSLFSEAALDDVLKKLLQGPRFMRPEEDWVPATAGASCQRRWQLGVAPLAALFHDVCQPLATRATLDAFAYGLRLMALDGTIEEVPDTPRQWPLLRPPYRGTRGERLPPSPGSLLGGMWHPCDL